VEFTRKQLREHSGWSDWSVRQGLGQLENLGYVNRKCGSNGVQIVYELLFDPTTESRADLFLTAVAELQNQLKMAAKACAEPSQSRKNGKKRNGPLVPCETL